MTGIVALVPGVRALLPRYASIDDPVADLRAACVKAVGELGPRIRVVASSPGAAEVGAALVVAADAEVVDTEETGVLVVGNGSAKRTEKAPGHLDERAGPFDDALRAALLGDLAALADVDAALAEDLWADVAALDVLPSLAAGRPDVLYDDAPFGVQYWVISWPANGPIGSDGN